MSLSAMRRLHHTSNGLMEFLLCETFAWAGARGIERISLNFNAFGDLLRTSGGLNGIQHDLFLQLAWALVFGLAAWARFTTKDVLA